MKLDQKKVTFDPNPMKKHGPANGEMKYRGCSVRELFFSDEETFREGPETREALLEASRAGLSVIRKQILQKARRLSI